MKCSKFPPLVEYDCNDNRATSAGSGNLVKSPSADEAEQKVLKMLENY